MIELGGNIKLEGFDNIGPAQLIVVKKVVGNYAKDISGKVEFSELLVTLKDEGAMAIKVTAKDKTIEEEESTDNLFITLDKVLAKVKNSI